jgi:hypothetical protein
VPPHLSAVPPAWRCSFWPARLRSCVKSRARTRGDCMPMCACVNVGTALVSDAHTLRMNIRDREG